MNKVSNDDVHDDFIDLTTRKMLFMMLTLIMMFMMMLLLLVVMMKVFRFPSMMSLTV